MSHFGLFAWATQNETGLSTDPTVTDTGAIEEDGEGVEVKGQRSRSPRKTNWEPQASLEVSSFS